MASSTPKDFILDDFRLYVREELDESESTADAYRLAAKQFLEFLESRPPRARWLHALFGGRIDERAVSEFIHSRRRLDTPESRQKKREALRAFLLYRARKGRLGPVAALVEYWKKRPAMVLLGALVAVVAAAEAIMQLAGTSPAQLYAAAFPSATPTASVTPPPTLTPTMTLMPTPTITPTASITPTANPTQDFLATFAATPDAGFVPATRTTAGKLMQVWVPAGSFMAGDHSARGDADEVLHQVYTDGFWIDQYLVTNHQYAQCPTEICGQPQMLDSHKRPDGYYGVPAYAEYPVMQITWQQAETFCEWRGGRLPTEAEWEKAAGWDPRTSEMRIYPWGNQPPDKTLANYANVDLDTTQVGSYPKGVSAVGAYDMAGNIWEWVHDWYGSYDLAVGVNPMGPSSGEYRVVRGGSWSNTTVESYLRVSNRGKNLPDHANNEIGFRCASLK